MRVKHSYPSDDLPSGFLNPGPSRTSSSLCPSSKVAEPLLAPPAPAGCCCYCCPLWLVKLPSEALNSGPSTWGMGLSDVHLWPVLLWALAWVQSTRSACPSCGGPTLAPQGERALVLELAKQQILKGLHLTSRPKISRPLPQAALTRALRRLQPQSVVPGNREEVISFATTVGG